MLNRFRRFSSWTPTQKVLTYHSLASLGVMLLVAIAAAAIAQQVARNESERDARWVGGLYASGLIGPLVTAGVREGDPDALSVLDRAAKARIAESQVVRIKVWAADGTVLYSDASQLIGRRFTLEDEDLGVLLGTEPADSELSDSDRPENVYERGMGQLVEVYARAVDQTGQPVLVETYFSAQRLYDRARQLERASLTVLLSALFLLALLLLPLSVWLAKRAERFERERIAAERAVADSVLAERKRLAAELHDGVIQDLTGVGYALYSLSRTVENQAASGAGDGVHEVLSAVDRIGDIVRSDIAVLRGVSTSMYVSQGKDIDLARMIRDLAATEGVPAGVGALPPLSTAVVSAVFQVAREALRNALRHSGTVPRLTLQVENERLSLVVADDGTGFDPDRVIGVSDGHLGLTLLEDAAARVGGVLEVRTAPGAGTVVQLMIDLRHVPGPLRTDVLTAEAMNPGSSLSATH